MTADLLAPAMAAILARHPDLRVQLRVDAQVVSFARDDVDIAVRLTRPKDKRWVARRVARFEGGLFASRAYLARAPAQSLVDHRFISYDDSYGAALAENVWLKRVGLDRNVVLRSGSSRAILEATRAGVGVGLLPSYLARRFSDLVALELPAPLPPRHVYLVTHEDIRSRPVVRAIWDSLITALVAIEHGQA